MLTFTRSQADSPAAARALIFKEACRIMQTVSEMLSRMQLGHPPAANTLQSMEERMRELVDQIFALREEELHDSRVEEVIWLETGDK